MKVLKGLNFLLSNNWVISEERSKPIVAVDGGVGAGIGDDVLITQGALHE